MKFYFIKSESYSDGRGRQSAQTCYIVKINTIAACSFLCKDGYVVLGTQGVIILTCFCVLFHEFSVFIWSINKFIMLVAGLYRPRYAIILLAQ